jgi:hypothetical protein
MDALSDIFMLEKKLSEIGLIKGTVRDILPKKSQASELEESFMLLSTRDFQV